MSYGHSLPEGDLELRLLHDLGIVDVHADEVHADPAAAARRALQRIESAAPAFIVHVDVDVLSFVEAPLADVPDSGGDPIGLRLDELATGLATFAASPQFAGLVLTEVTPDHVPDPDVLRQFVKVLAGAI